MRVSSSTDLVEWRELRAQRNCGCSARAAARLRSAACFYVYMLCVGFSFLSTFQSLLNSVPFSASPCLPVLHAPSQAVTFPQAQPVPFESPRYASFRGLDFFSLLLWCLCVCGYRAWIPITKENKSHSLVGDSQSPNGPTVQLMATLGWR